MPTIYDLLAKIGWDTNAKELEKSIDLTRQQGKMYDELKLKGARLEQQIVKTNDPKKLKKYNAELQETRKRADAITESNKKQAASVDVLTKRQKELHEALRKNNDPKIVQGLLRELHKVENQLHVITAQATALPAKVGGIGKTLMSAFAGGLIGGGIVGAIQLASSAITGFFGDSIAEAAEAEQGLLKFKQTLDNLGKGKYFDALVSDADRLAKVYKNLFDNDDILAGQAKFIEGTRVTKAQLSQLIPVAIELAAKLQTDVATAAEMLAQTIGTGRVPMELKRFGLNIKGIGDETGRVNEITGDFAKLLSGSVDTALQTATGSAKQLKQELANMEEEIGRQLLPLQKKLNQLKLTALTTANYIFGGDERQLEIRADIINKQAGLDKSEIASLEILNGKRLQLLKEGRVSEAKIESDFQKRIAQIEDQKTKDYLNSRNRPRGMGEFFEETARAKASLEAFKSAAAKYKKDLDNASINANAGLDDPTEKAKGGETAEQRAARLLREQEASNKIIQDARLSLLEEEAREIAMREAKHEEDKKKLRKVSAADRLIFEEAFQQDLADIHDKYNQKELNRLDKQIADIDAKTEAGMRARIKEGQDTDARQEKLQADNLKGMQDYVKGRTELAEEGYNEEMAAQDLLIQNTRDLIAVGQDALAAEQRRIEKQISLQEDRVESARKSSTASVKIEEDRLNELIAKRRKYEQAQRTIDAAVIVANQAVAISGAIRTIATSGNPVLIAANVAAIAAGIIASTLAVRSAFSDDGFYEGGYTGDGNPHQTSTAQGRRGYKYHKGEFVMNHELTDKHRDMFEGIHKGELMVKQIGDGYYLAPQLDVEGAVSDAGASRAMDVHGLETKLDYIATLLMQRELKVNNNFDSDGFGQSVAGSLNQITIKNLMRK